VTTTSLLQGARLLLRVQLTSYSNPKRWVSNGMQCYDNSPLPTFGKPSGSGGESPTLCPRYG